MEMEEKEIEKEVQMQREIILEKLREKGCRITKQRQNLIDTILQNECASCKEIFYQALAQNQRIGIATVYRMVNLLEEIGAIDRKNMYKVGLDLKQPEKSCRILRDSGREYKLSVPEWNAVVHEGLKACGYLSEDKM